MKRILILGNAGAGKSTLARQLGEVLRLPVVHLDALFWRPGWKDMPRDEWARLVTSLVARDAWIMDGNYLGTLPARLTAADAVVVLNVPRVLCLYRVLVRGVTQRGQHRADLGEGCAEQLPDLAFLRWIWRFPQDDLQPVLEQVNAVRSTKSVTILHSIADAQRYVHELRAQSLVQTSAAQVQAI